MLVVPIVPPNSPFARSVMSIGALVGLAPEIVIHSEADTGTAAMERLAIQRPATEARQLIQTLPSVSASPNNRREKTSTSGPRRR